MLHATCISQNIVIISMHYDSFLKPHVPIHVYYECGVFASLAGGYRENELPSLLTERAMETIRLLRRELERCQSDLQTDEELFAEKTEELSRLQSAYNVLLKEKGRLEEMWLASQEKEGLLESEVYQLKAHLSSMARKLAEIGGREGEKEGDSLGSGGGVEVDDDSLKEIEPSESA